MLRLRDRIVLGGGALALLLAAALGGGFYALDRVAGSVDLQVEREFASSRLLGECRHLVSELHSEVWDAMLSPPAERAPARARLDALARTFYSTLRELRDRPGTEDPSLDEIQLAFQTYYVFGSRILDLRDMTQLEASEDLARKFVANKRDLMERLERRAPPSQQAFAASLERLRRAFATARVITASFLILSTALAVALLWAAARLAEAHRHLSSVVDSLSSILVTVDERGLVTGWNARAARLTGVTASRAKGQLPERFLPPLAAFRSRIERVIEDGQPLLLSREPWAAEGLRRVDVAVYPLAPGGGAVIRLDDVTEVVARDEALRRAQRMDTVRVLAGGLAHDFNNVLVAIVGTAASLREEVEGGTLDLREVGECVDSIEQAAGRAAELVQDLLGLSRKREPAFARQDLAPVVASAVKVCRATLEESVEVALHLPGEPVLVRGEATQLHQVIVNLCINGWHAMTLMRAPGEPKGGRLAVTLSEVELGQARLAVHAGARPGRWALVSVRDTGVGMDAATLEKIFDPFYSTKDGGQGTGLGLAMAFTIVQQHGGFIDVHSEKGRGSEFQVCLPVAMDAVAARDGTAGPGAGAVRGIDDPPAIPGEGG